MEVMLRQIEAEIRYIDFNMARDWLFLRGVLRVPKEIEEINYNDRK